MRTQKDVLEAGKAIIAIERGQAARSVDSLLVEGRRM